MIPSKRKYPKELIINDEHYKVIFKQKKLMDGNLGYMIPSTKEIQIASGQNKEETFKTLIHEIIHAFEDEYSFRLKHSHVYKLEEAIYNFLINNF